MPEWRFDHVNVDLVGPLSPSCGYTYLLTMVDRTPRWPEVVSLVLHYIFAEVARAFVMAWVARFRHTINNKFHLLLLLLLLLQ